MIIRKHKIKTILWTYIIESSRIIPIFFNLIKKIFFDMVHAVFWLTIYLLLGNFQIFTRCNLFYQKQVFLRKIAHDIDPERNLKSNFDRFNRASKIWYIWGQKLHGSTEWSFKKLINIFNILNFQSLISRQITIEKNFHQFLWYQHKKRS